MTGADLLTGILALIGAATLACGLIAILGRLAARKIERAEAEDFYGTADREWGDYPHLPPEARR